jgi:phage terminase large subunit-like protein
MGQVWTTGKSYVEKANQYIHDVLNGVIPASKLTQRACERQLKNLEWQQDPSWAYRFDNDKAERVCFFIEQCPHIKGKKFANTPIHLEGWQCFVLTTAFGWLDKETDLRRFRRCYIEVAKGNGKTPLMSALCNYMAFMDGEPGAEVYCAATSRAQANLLFNTSQGMLRKMPEFCSRAGVEVTAHSINQLSSTSFFRPLSSEAGGVEGINPYFIVVDELHEHKSRDLYDNLDTANGKRDGSMLFAITTAGSNRAGICYDVRDYIVKILENVFSDESVFGCIWTIDADDDWAAGPDVWRKANPNWGVCVDPKEIGLKANAAIQQTSKQPTFQQKHLNLWTSTDHAWMDMRKWEACADAKLSDVDFETLPCIVGMDLAAKLDLLSLTRVFWKDLDDPVTKKMKRHYYIFGTNMLPEARIELAQHAQYAAWANDGWIDTCPGETNDYDEVEAYVRDWAKRFYVQEVAHDQYNSTSIVNHLMPEGFQMREVPQLPKYLSPAMKELEAAVYDKRLHFDGDPVLTWAISNVVCHPDKNDNIFPNKEHQDNKIDPVVALLMAINRVMFIPVHQEAFAVEFW